MPNDRILICRIEPHQGEITFQRQVNCTTVITIGQHPTMTQLCIGIISSTGGKGHIIDPCQRDIVAVITRRKQPTMTQLCIRISNVSFGLPAAGREVLNAVFLYHGVQAGLDMAIVNAEKLERYAAIPEAERLLAEDLLFDRGDDPIAAFANHFRDRPPTAGKDELAAMPLDERLAH